MQVEKKHENILHKIPDYARAINAGCDTLGVVFTNFDTGHRCFVFLQQMMSSYIYMSLKIHQCKILGLSYIFKAKAKIKDKLRAWSTV